MKLRRRLSAAATICAALLLVVAPVAVGAPASDDRGFIDSTARCAAPSSAVMFGRTASSRVAICAESDGTYQYRGVRVRDGARLITTAEPEGEGFTADNHGVTYTMTSDSLVVAEGGRVIREEPMVEVEKHSAAPAAGAATSTPVPSTGEPSPTRTTPLPPPLPAEVGGSGS